MHYIKDILSYKLYTTFQQLAGASKCIYQELGITRANYVTMHIIHEQPGITQAGLAILNDKDRNVITRVIDRLEEKGYVRRERCIHDRRSFSLYLTEEGERIIDDYWPRFIQDEQDCLNKLDPEEQKLFMSMLERLMQD